MLIIGNKIDLISERKLKNSDIQNYVNNLQKEKNLVYINYNQVSVKDNKNIEGLYQEILFFYYQQRINTKIAHNPKEEEKTSTSTKSEEKKDIKKPNLNKNMVIFHQMLDQIKKPLIAEISRLKEENKKDKLNMEKKFKI
jgi:GTPase involved in cell partitioning and DNA repair